MPTDDIFDDPNLNEMMMNPDLFGIDDGLSKYGKMYDFDENVKVAFDELVDEEDEDVEGNQFRKWKTICKRSYHSS